MEYASAQQAKVAINKFDGAMTKGQTISIKFLPPPRVTPSAGIAAAGGGLGAAANRPQTGASLLARIAKPSGGAPAPSAPARGAAQGGRGRGGPARGRGAAAAGRGGKRAGPADAGSLDQELDSFMKNDSAGDVAMA